jgi:hypothetical protein
MPDHRTVEWIIANTINDAAQGDSGRPGRPHRRRSDGSGIPAERRLDRDELSWPAPAAFSGNGASRRQAAPMAARYRRRSHSQA